MTALQKPWGSLVQVWCHCLWGLDLLQEPCGLGEEMVGEMVGGLIHPVCLAWHVWIFLIKTGRIDLHYIWDLLVSQATMLVFLSAWLTISSARSTFEFSWPYNCLQTSLTMEEHWNWATCLETKIKISHWFYW